MSLASFAMAQKPRFSIRPIIGYGLGLGREARGTDYDENTEGEQIKNKNLYYSAGQGIKLGLCAAYSIFDGVGVGADIGYSMGLTSEVAKDRYLNTWDSTWATSTTKTKTSYIFFSPSAVFEKGIMGMIPFCGFGLTFALAPKSVRTYEYSATGYKVVREGEHTYKLGMGSCGVVGVKYALMGGLELTGELRVDQLSFKASHRKLTKYTENGIDRLADTPTRYKEIEYREDDTEDNWHDESKPEIANTFVVPANSLSIRVGVGYSF